MQTCTYSQPTWRLRSRPTWVCLRPVTRCPAPPWMRPSFLTSTWISSPDGDARSGSAARAARAAEPLRASPSGELIHVDVKKLGRIQGGAGHRVTGRKHTHVGRERKRHVGWEYVHVCIDDATRLAYVEVLDDEKATSAVGFLRRAVAFYAGHGITCLLYTS